MQQNDNIPTIVAIFATIAAIYAIQADEERLSAVIIALLLGFLYIARRHFFALWAGTRAALEARWNSVDMKKRPVYIRPLAILWGVFFRFLAQLKYKPELYVIIFGAFMGLLFYVAIENASSLLPTYIGWDGLSKAFAVSAVPLVITFVAYVFFREIAQSAANKANPHRKTIMQFIDSFEDYKRDFGKCTVREIRRAIAVDDHGPILIISIAARDFLACSNDPTSNAPRCDIFTEAWRHDPNKKFLMLLSDPTSEAVVRRNRSVHGRYLEYYAIPYLRMMFHWHEEKSSSRNRITFRRYCNEPDVRIVMSKDRLVMQRYGPLQLGDRDTPVILHRVTFSTSLEKRFSLKPCWDSRGNECCLGQSEVWEEKGKILASEPRSIFDKFATAFDRVYRTEGEDEIFLTDWKEDRLRRFARLCRVPIRIVDRASARGKLPSVICEYLDLTTEFEMACKNSNSPPGYQ